MHAIIFAVSDLTNGEDFPGICLCLDLPRPGHGGIIEYKPDRMRLGMERLQKVLACAGVASRRKCEELILQGRVRVNGQVVTQLGTKVDPARDIIEVDRQPITLEKKVYILLHKPRGYLSDTLDFRGRPSALALVPGGERLYPAGRLDARSEGLLLLTNDGELAHRLTHPRYEHEY